MHFFYIYILAISNKILSWQDGRAVKALASGASREICVGSSPTLVNMYSFCLRVGHSVVSSRSWCLFELLKMGLWSVRFAERTLEATRERGDDAYDCVCARASSCDSNPHARIIACSF